MQPGMHKHAHRSSTALFLFYFCMHLILHLFDSVAVFYAIEPGLVLILYHKNINVSWYDSKSSWKSS